MLPDVGAFGLPLSGCLGPSEARTNASAAAVVDSGDLNQGLNAGEVAGLWVFALRWNAVRNERVNPAEAGTRVSHTSHVI